MGIYQENICREARCGLKKLEIVSDFVYTGSICSEDQFFVGFEVRQNYVGSAQSLPVMTYLLHFSSVA